MDEKDKQTHVKTLQSLQMEINSLNKIKEKYPSLEKTIEILRNSQDKLYSALAEHGVTAEEVYKVIMENNDKVLVKEVLQLQNARNAVKNQLMTPKLTPEKRQSLEKRLARATRKHADKWDEIINHPNRVNLINKIEQAQIKALQKEERDKSHESDRSR